MYILIPVESILHRDMISDQLKNINCRYIWCDVFHLVLPSHEKAQNWSNWADLTWSGFLYQTIVNILKTAPAELKPHWKCVYTFL